MRSFHRLLIAVAATLGTVSLGQVADAGIATQTLSVVPSSVEVGEQITISGTGWTCVEPELSIDTDPATDLGFVTPDQVGAFELVVAAPATPGTYTVTAFDGECQWTETATFVVVAAATTTTTTTTVAPTTTTTTTTVAPTTVAPTTTAAATTTSSLAIAPVTALPVTGNPDGRVAVFAVFALLIGAAFVVLARRPGAS
jgi:hypothetical protein